MQLCVFFRRQSQANEFYSAYFLIMLVKTAVRFLCGAMRVRNSGKNAVPVPMLFYKTPDFFIVYIIHIVVLHS